MDTKVKPVEVLPLLKYYMEQLGLARMLDNFVPNSNGAEIAPAQVLCLLVMNIMVVNIRSTHPVKNQQVSGSRKHRFKG